MTILTMVKYEWFEEWKDTSVRKRGDEYYNYKMRFAKNLFDWACTLFPKIKDKVGLVFFCQRVNCKVSMLLFNVLTNLEFVYDLFFSCFSRTWRPH